MATRYDLSDPIVTRTLTPAGGMILSVVVSGVLWGGLVAAAHVVGLL